MTQHTITLSAEHLQVVLQALDGGPHRIVRPVIDAIMSQVQGAPDNGPHLREVS